MSSSLRVILGVALLFPVQVFADMLLFDATCDETWHTCCDCNVNMKCNNWNVPATPAPLCPSLPAIDDDVTIDRDCTIVAGMSGTTGTLMQSMGTFTLNGNLSIGTTADFAGPFVWNSGTIARAGGASATIELDSTMMMQGDDTKFLGGNAGFLNGAVELVNHSQLIWTDAGGLQMGPVPGGASPATIHTPAGALFSVRNDAAITGTSFGLGVLVVEGTLEKHSSTGTSNWNVRLVNDGLVHVQTGELRLTGTGSASGEFRIDNDAQLTLAPVFGLELEPGVSFTGEGQATLVDTGSSFGLQVLQNVSVNRVRVENSGAIGPNTNFGELTITELLQLDGADIRPPLVIAPGARLEHLGPNESFVGDLAIEGDVEIVAGNLSTRDRTITIESTGVVEIRDGAALRTAGLSNLPIQNNGTIQKTSGTGTASVLADFFELFFNNAGGLVHVASGTLDFAQSNIRSEGGDWRIDANAVLRAPGSFGGLFELNGGLLSGSGTLIVNRLNNNGGTVSPGASPGILTIAADANPSFRGNYQQGANGTLEIEIGGETPGTQSDQLVVAGTATLDGTLRVALIDGFVPASGQSFVVLTAGTRTGEFTTVDDDALPAGLSAVAEYDATSVAIRFTGQPINANENSSDDGNMNDNSSVNANDNGNGNANDNGAGNDSANDNGASDGDMNDDTNGNGAGNDNSADDGDLPPMMACGACGAGMSAFFPLSVASYATFIGFRRARRRTRDAGRA